MRFWYATYTSPDCTFSLCFGIIHASGEFSQVMARILVRSGQAKIPMANQMSLIFMPLKCTTKVWQVFTAPKFSQVIRILLPYQVSDLIDLILQHIRKVDMASYWLHVIVICAWWSDECTFQIWIFIFLLLQMVLVLDVTTRWPSSSSI